MSKKYYSEWDSVLGLERHVFSTFFLLKAHTFGFLGILMIITGQVPRTVFIFSLLHSALVFLGVTIGVHRYWSHRTFKATLPLQLILAYLQTAAGQYSIFQWCRDHRLHHKFGDTDADPYNTKRGFWFAHTGWLLTKEHPAAKEKEATLDFSDLDNDPIVRFQARYYWWIGPIIFFVIPMLTQHWIWPSMSVYQLFCVNYIWYLISLHSTFIINSGAHRWGNRPYDKSFNASDLGWINMLTFGEGWHNYHHAFPWDYRSSEWGFYSKRWSIIDLLAWAGLAYDLKTVNRKLVAERAKRTGDGSYPQHTGDAQPQETALAPNSATWGWGDDDITAQDYQLTDSLRKRSE